ncbi:MAG: alpha/beta hydrolase, partial [Pseudomonadota bacterium]
AQTARVSLNRIREIAVADTQTEMDMVLGFLTQSNEAAGDDPSLEDRRKGMDTLGDVMPLAIGASVEDVELGGVSGLKITPAETLGARTLLYFHGGGYILGSPASHRAFVSELTTRLKATAYSMDYRLAPEAPFPAAPEDGLVTYRGLLDMGIDAADIIIAGDSAGGGLTMATALKIKEAGLPQPAALMPISPWVNMACDGWAFSVMDGRDPMITYDGLSDMAANYLNGADAADPIASPIHADLSGLPPVLIQVGSEEALLSDSTTLAERAGTARVDVTLEIWPGMIHVFQVFHAMLSDARRAMDHMAHWSENRWKA